MTEEEILRLQRDPEFISMSVMVQKTRARPNRPQFCTWCGVMVNTVDMYLCDETQCFEGLHQCGPCIVLAHRQRPFHKLWKWAQGDTAWTIDGRNLTKLGMIWQRGHDGLPCPNPDPEIMEQPIIGAGYGWKIKVRQCLCWAKEKAQAEEAKLKREEEEERARQERETEGEREEDWEDI
ncbi:hypothetical protein C8R47DRAFT_1228805 [Mycena vitilis]|nr:hypothetical protein C8R47DRAFT_1228805 [Mycena vitilis]